MRSDRQMRCNAKPVSIFLPVEIFSPRQVRVVRVRDKGVEKKNNLWAPDHILYTIYSSDLRASPVIWARERERKREREREKKEWGRERKSERVSERERKSEREKEWVRERKLYVSILPLPSIPPLLPLPSPVSLLVWSQGFNIQMLHGVCQISRTTRLVLQNWCN